MFKSNEENKRNATQERNREATYYFQVSQRTCCKGHMERSGQLWESHKGVRLSVIAETLDEYRDVSLPFLIMHYNGLYLRLNL